MRLIDEVLNTPERMLVLVVSRDPELTEPPPDQIHDVGVTAVVQRMVRVPDGTVRILVQGRRRVRVGPYTQTEPFLVGPRRGDAGPRRAHHRGRGARAQPPGRLHADDRAGAPPARRAAGRGRQPRGPDDAVVPDRLLDPPVGGGAPGAARGGRPGGAAAPPDGALHPRARAAGAGREDPERRPARHGQEPARVLPAPAAEGDPRGARRGAATPAPRSRSCASGWPRSTRPRRCAPPPSASWRAWSACRRSRPSTGSCAPTSTGSSRSPGARPPRTTSTSSARARSSTRTTTTSRR